MEIATVQTCRKELEAAVLALVQDFETRTGCQVASMSLRSDGALIGSGRTPRTINAEATVIL